ncbi:MAG: aldo/keto reductase [Planctomycetales bacterium]|nr:aldo/keto reductase [Planctomycetales bacterium]
MTTHDSRELPRRRFLQGAGALGGGLLLLERAGLAVADDSTDTLPMPQRILGKTNQKVSALALGTWPCGRSDTVDTNAVAAIVNEAIELGINLIDTAHNYGNAEEGIGRALGGKRKNVFLTTKVWADSVEQAQASLDESLRALKTDYLDLVYLHSMGDRDVEQAGGDDGALTYLLKQKDAGKIRFVGLSGHSKVARFVPIIESGQIDVVMVAMNFVDRHIYGFEDTVLPAARKHNVGVACMKVFGGIRGGFGAAVGPNPGPQMDSQWLELAVRYAMGLPGVATLVIGPHTLDQLRANVRMVKNYQPLTDEQQAELQTVGRQLAAQWGEHYGPVA